VIALDLLFDVPFGLVGAGLAFTVIAICRLVPSRLRSWMALAVFFSGSFAAWRLLSGREVWPAAWIPFLLTIVGGGASLLPTLRSAGGLWTRASRHVTAASTLLVVAVALAVSYADANRGVPAILMLAGPNPESYFDVAELRIRERPCRIRYVQEDLREEPGRPVVFWTWEQDCPVPWDELSRVPEALFLVEFDSGSGISSTCVRPATDEATRERVEGLIAEWWSRQATLLPAPKPDLRGKTIFRMVRCEYLDRFYEKRKQYASEKGHEFIEIHGPTAVLAFPWKRSKPGSSVEWSGWYSGDTASSVDKVRECLRTNRVAYRTIHADVLLVEAEGAISRFERRDLGESGFLLFRPGEAPRRIACSSAAECATEFSRVAPRYFGHPECSASPERAAASG
jgi:hypothetical protein